MIIHCSRKLAERLPGVSTQPLAETSKMGYPQQVMDRALSLLSPLEFDLATNRSVQATMRITIMDVDGYAKDSEYLWPARGMKEFIEGLDKKPQLHLVK